MVKLRVHKTGHQIADTVADAFIAGNYEGDADLVYGILRHDVFSKSDRWFNIDRGYFGANHFDGTYRISYKGTQAKWHEDIPKQDIDFKLYGWESSMGKIVLICPPSDAVCEFFSINKNEWIQWAINRTQDKRFEIRYKENQESVNWQLTAGVITFNSSIGSQALQRGIPVYSDPDHSIIGSYYKAKLKNPIDFLSDEYRAIDREPLFKSMRAHQFTLKEISEGKAWPLLKHYLRE